MEYNYSRVTGMENIRTRTMKATTIKRIIIATGKALVVGSLLSKEIATEAGASTLVAKSAFVVAFIGDNLVPLIPVGTIVIIISAMLIKPSAPVHVIQKAYKVWKSKKAA